MKNLSCQNPVEIDYHEYVACGKCPPCVERNWNPIKAIYEQYLEGLKQLVPGQRLPTGETIESEIKRVKAHLKTFK